VDRAGWRTEFVAIGNWRVIGQDTARLLARHGAQLVHSAPSTGVRDWSDLRIAVSAGVWLAAARPGDVLEIVSDDRAFDAVGDVATGLGIAFHRLSSRALTGAAPAEPREAASVGESRRRHGRRGRRGGRAPAAVAEPRRHEPAHAAPAGEAHTAPHDEIVDLVRELAQREQNGAVLIDTLARALKARGFSRPPGSAPGAELVGQGRGLTRVHVEVDPELLEGSDALAVPFVRHDVEQAQRGGAHVQERRLDAHRVAGAQRAADRELELERREAATL